MFIVIVAAWKWLVGVETSYGDTHCGSRPCGLYVEMVVVPAQDPNNERPGDNHALRLRSEITQLLSASRGVETLCRVHNIDVLSCIAKHVFDIFCVFNSVLWYL